jgi:hypothetical protein
MGISRLSTTNRNVARRSERHRRRDPQRRAQVVAFEAWQRTQALHPWPKSVPRPPQAGITDGLPDMCTR